MITLSLWGFLYSTHIDKELAIQETILNTWSLYSTNLGLIGRFKQKLNIINNQISERHLSTLKNI